MTQENGQEPKNLSWKELMKHLRPIRLADLKEENEEPQTTMDQNLQQQELPELGNPDFMETSQEEMEREDREEQEWSAERGIPVEDLRHVLEQEAEAQGITLEKLVAKIREEKAQNSQ